MHKNLLSIKKSLNKAYLKEKVQRIDVDNFKTNLSKLYKRINEDESEENDKGHLKDFLNDCYYKDAHLIATKDRVDLVIHNEKTPKSTVGVLFEVKRTKNVSEMVTVDQVNVKALHELVLYYLRERLDNKNFEIKNLVITNIYEWFIFDENVFDKCILQNKNFIKAYEHFSQVGKNNDSFYSQLKNELIPPILENLTYTHFDLRTYKKIAKNEDIKNDKKLIPLYKALSPTHLLKLPFANDSNSLDKRFYSELLHIIGLEEKKIKSKKVIQRKSETEREEGSLLENTIAILKSRDKLRHAPNLRSYGAIIDEQYFGVGLELCITWLNRILFLKLLEAQLINYHDGNNDYRFLNIKKIKDFDELDELFFEVLAVKIPDRGEYQKEKFGHVPYLNSSLFEANELEEATISVSNLKDRFEIKPLPITILKDNKGKKRTSKLKTLEYLFDFLDAYDFSSEGLDDIQEDNKTLINASVLGLIFEKINGYKDGSFFTPGFITMYMCRETIRRAVIQKFNEVKGWKCKNFDDLYNEIEDLTEANEVINSLKICDPAVGSGHFLVSALNEIISIKSDLKILLDGNGRRLKEYTFLIENDELIVTDEDDNFFTYKPTNKESQRIQETLFREKKNIIENCLFGVDINPNSVKICRLRLWIELLKNAYYKADLNNQELETLPNIDINIKEGNSLISRFELEDNLKAAFKQSNYSVQDYKNAVKDYKHSTGKEEKRRLTGIINEIKNSFQDTITTKIKKRLATARGKIENHENQLNNLKLFGEKVSKKDQIELKKLKNNLVKEEAKRDEILNNLIYRDAFEWRFEFPEVLDNEGKYIGFDCVIGNPPYYQIQKMDTDIKAVKEKYFTYQQTGDLYSLFYEKGNAILRRKGVLHFITGSAWLRSNYGKSLRTFFLGQTNLIELLDLSDCEVFESATVLTSLVFFEKNKFEDKLQVVRFTKKDQNKLFDLKANFENEKFHLSNLTENSWIITDRKTDIIKRKVEKQGKPLKDWNIDIFYGIKTGYNEAFIIDEETRIQLIKEDPNCESLIRPILRGRDIQKYFYEFQNKYLIATFPSRNYSIEDYPSIKNYLKKFGKKLEQIGEKYIDKNGDKISTRKKSNNQWFETQDNIAYWKDFENPKIIYPNMTKFLPFTYDHNGILINDKCFLLTGEKLFYLVSFLNSKLFKFCYADAFPELQGNSKEVKKFILENLHFKEVDEKIDKYFGNKVKQILKLKKNDTNYNTTILENEIDKMVYSIYDLTAEEIKIIENSIS